MITLLTCVATFIIGYLLMRSANPRDTYDYRHEIAALTGRNDTLDQLRIDQLNYKEERELRRRMYHYDEQLLEQQMEGWQFHAKQVKKAEERVGEITLTAEQQLEYLPAYLEYLVEVKLKNVGKEWPETRIEMDFKPWLAMKMLMPYTGFAEYPIFLWKPTLRIQYV